MVTLGHLHSARIQIAPCSCVVVLVDTARAIIARWVASDGRAAVWARVVTVGRHPGIKLHIDYIGRSKGELVYTLGYRRSRLARAVIFTVAVCWVGGGVRSALVTLVLCTSPRALLTLL
eukprot:8190670-Pyramimonas_sp.AAC.1